MVSRLGTEELMALLRPYTGGKHPLVAFAGPSGVGKSTIIKTLTSEIPHYKVRVSHTTRQPRRGEQHGIHYHFISKEHIEEGIRRESYIEIARVHSHYYGTSISSVHDVLKGNRMCILDIDIQGCESVKKSFLKDWCKFVFIKPPSLNFLESRLRGRGTESEDAIQVRLNSAKRELEFMEANRDFFHHVLTHTEIAETFPRLRDLLRHDIEHHQSLHNQRLPRE